jgi:hypothetical protein
LEELQYIKDSLAQMKKWQSKDDWMKGDEYLYVLADRGYLDRLIDSYEQLQKDIELYKIQESFLFERLKKQTLQIKEINSNRLIIEFNRIVEENASLKEQLSNSGNPS